MKLKLFFLFIPIIFSVNTMAGSVDIEQLTRKNQGYIGSFDTSNLNSNKVVLSMDFNSPVIKNPENINGLRGRTIEKIELVYTAYKQAESFNQPKLNKERLQALENLAPFLFKNSRVNWNFYAQTNGKNETEAKKLFHGFVITLKPEPGISLLEKELNYLTELIDNDSLGIDTMVIGPQFKIKRKRIATGYYLPRSSFKREQGKLYTKKSIWNRHKQHIYRYDTTIKYVKINQFHVSDRAQKYISKLRDSTVMSVLSRNSNWKEILFICDVTGSMAPYTAQILIWNKLNFNSRRAKYYTFFNDGDNMPDGMKRLGNTGGIYHIEANKVSEIEQMAKTAMRNGWGGDQAENYIESILSALKKFPEAKEVVVIADNWAPIKDIELLHRIRVPVHVILCGTDGGIHPDYVKLAVKTAGSLHTMEEDLPRLNKTAEGAKIKLSGKLYQWSKGKLKRLEPI